MFYDIRFQTGEISEIINEMKKGNIPCMDVNDTEEFIRFTGRLAENGIYRVDGMPFDRNARDRVKEPDFEFRAPFCEKPCKAREIKPEKLMYIDVYFEPTEDETYDSIGEM